MHHGENQQFVGTSKSPPSTPHTPHEPEQRAAPLKSYYGRVALCVVASRLQAAPLGMGPRRQGAGALVSVPVIRYGAISVPVVRYLA